MLGNSLLSTLLRAVVLYFAASNRLLAQDPPDEIRWNDLDSAPSGTPVWMENTSEPVLQRLPPPDEVLSLDAQPTIVRPPIDRVRVASPIESGRAPVAIQMSWIPAQDLKNQLAELAMNREELALAFPVRIAPEGMWLALGSFERLEIATTALLPDSGRAAPDQLWNVELGAMHLRDLGDGWRSGGIFRVGSPSDRPFEAWRDMTVTLLGFLTVPSGEQNAWSFSLFYSPTGQIIFPIPGIAYVWRPSSQFEANLGIPFSMTYRPTETLSLSASYRPLTDARVFVRKSLGELWSIYGGYETVNETYLLADRLHDRERTYIFDQRLVLGAQRQLGRGWSVDVSAAYAFDRQIFQAESFTGDHQDELAIDPGLAGTIQLMWTR